MADKYLLEDGSGHYQLEDGSGDYLLEPAAPPDIDGDAWFAGTLPAVLAIITLATPIIGGGAGSGGESGQALAPAEDFFYQPPPPPPAKPHFFQPIQTDDEKLFVRDYEDAFQQPRAFDLKPTIWVSYGADDWTPILDHDPGFQPSVPRETSVVWPLIGAPDEDLPQQPAVFVPDDDAQWPTVIAAQPEIGQAAGSGGEFGAALVTAPPEDDSLQPWAPPVAPVVRQGGAEDEYPEQPVTFGLEETAFQPWVPPILPVVRQGGAEDEYPPQAVAFGLDDSDFQPTLPPPQPLIGQAAGSGGEFGAAVSVTFGLDEDAAAATLPTWGPAPVVQLTIWALTENFLRAVEDNEQFPLSRPAIVPPTLYYLWAGYVDEYAHIPFGLFEVDDYRTPTPVPAPVIVRQGGAEDEIPEPAVPFGLDETGEGFVTWGPAQTIQLTIWGVTDTFSAVLSEDEFRPSLPVPPAMGRAVVVDDEWCPFIPPPVGNPDEDYYQQPYAVDTTISPALLQFTLGLGVEDSQPPPTATLPTHGGRGRPRIHFHGEIDCRIEAIGAPGVAQAVVSAPITVHQLTALASAVGGAANATVIQYAIPQDESEEEIMLLQMLMDEDLDE